LITGREMRRILSPYAALSQTVIQGKIESPWKIIEFIGRCEFGVSISIVPDVTESRPARMRNSVVLPQPLGPTIMKNSPCAISTDTPSIAVSCPNLLRRSRMRMAARAGSGSAGSSLASRRGILPLNLPGPNFIHNGYLATHAVRSGATACETSSIARDHRGG